MKRLFCGFSLAAMALLAACGSESGTNGEPLENSSNSSSESFNEYDSIVEEVGNLPKCVEGKDGEVYYVKEVGVAYTCRYDEDEETGEWINASEGSDGSSSSDETDEGKSSASEEPESSGSEGVEGSSASVPGGSSDASAYDVVTGTLNDSRDGQTYRTVKIGGQVWMAENLNYAYTGVPFGYDGNTSDSTSWCFDNDPANCAKYGRLYTWAAAMDSVGEWSTSGKGCGYGKECSATSPVRGVCPKGWHLPSQAEWNALFTAVGGFSTAGTKLKSVTGWNAFIDITNEDAFGFSALPAGYRHHDDGRYYNEGYNAYFWSSAEHDSDGTHLIYYDIDGAYLMSLYYSNDDAYLENVFKDTGVSVRCLKD